MEISDKQLEAVQEHLSNMRDLGPSDGTYEKIADGEAVRYCFDGDDGMAFLWEFNQVLKILLPERAAQYRGI